MGAARRSITHATYASSTSLIQYVHRSRHTGVVRVQRKLDTTWHGGQRRLMKDAVNALDRFSNRLGVSNIAFGKLDLVGNMLKGYL